jgi:hypothetical protein
MLGVRAGIMSFAPHFLRVDLTNPRLLLTPQEAPYETLG